MESCLLIAIKWMNSTARQIKTNWGIYRTLEREALQIATTKKSSWEWDQKDNELRKMGEGEKAVWKASETCAWLESLSWTRLQLDVSNEVAKFEIQGQEEGRNAVKQTLHRKSLQWIRTSRRELPELDRNLLIAMGVFDMWDKYWMEWQSGLGWK